MSGRKNDRSGGGVDPPHPGPGGYLENNRDRNLRTAEFANVIWVRVHTDAGVIGLGETFYGAGAVELHIHDTLRSACSAAIPCRSRRIHREMLNLPMAQSSTGVEYRAASAIDIALWDTVREGLGQPVHQMLGGLCRPKAAHLQYLRRLRICRDPTTSSRSPPGILPSAGPYEDLQAS